MEKPLILAYYLPQYHPFKENDEWWGKGFTEWTNVGKAKPLFPTHEQPRVPADLGYYDLRLPEVREKQAELAKEAGVDGFCYWHYWFGGQGRQLLNEIIDDVIEKGSPDFPFCFGWANETWKAKQWKDGSGDKVLMEQRYGGEEDYRLHFEYALKAFNDPRYVRVDNKPVFVVYKPSLLADDFIPCWRRLAKEAGLDGIYFVARIMDLDTPDEALKKGFDVYTRERAIFVTDNVGKLKYYMYKIRSRLLGIKGTVISYKDCVKHMADKKEDAREDFCPSIMPNWDHSPRSGRRAYIITNAYPSLFYQHVMSIFENIKNKKNKIVFLKSWNEWGEGNYMEPDMRFGKGYIEALAKARKESGY